jgi:hypothetical protein
MAQLARKRRFRKSPPSTGHSATPRRNTRRMTYTKTFRFNDLTPELRDMIYTFALQDENNSRLELIRQLPSTAKALRQVSRAVGAASLAVYYSKNLFEVNLDCEHYMICDDIEFINGWISVFGGFAVHHLRSIRIYIIANDAHRGETLTIDLTDSAHPVTWNREFHHGKWLTAVTTLYRADVEEFVLSEIWPEGKRVRTTEGPFQLLTGLNGVIERRVCLAQNGLMD